MHIWYRSISIDRWSYLYTCNTRAILINKLQLMNRPKTRSAKRHKPMLSLCTAPAGVSQTTPLSLSVIGHILFSFSCILLLLLLHKEKHTSTTFVHRISNKINKAAVKIDSRNVDIVADDLLLVRSWSYEVVENLPLAMQCEGWAWRMQMQPANGG